MAKYKLTDFGRQHTAAMKRMQSNADQALGMAALYLEAQLKLEIEHKAHDEGHFGNSVVAQKTSSSSYEVGSALIYAPVLEYGRKPGKLPNLDALVGRAGRKGMIHAGKTEEYDNLDHKDKGVVYSIARKIQLKGTEGKFIFKNTLEREKKNILAVFKDYFYND